MMAMLWSQQIMLGKKTYSQVPRLLKDKVKREGKALQTEPEGGKEKWKTFPEFTIYPLTRDGNSYPSIWCRGFRP